MGRYPAPAEAVVLAVAVIALVSFLAYLFAT